MKIERRQSSTTRATELPWTHLRHRGQDSVDSTFSMKMLVNCAYIWLVDLVQFQDDAAGAILFKVPSFGILVGEG